VALKVRGQGGSCLAVPDRHQRKRATQRRPEESLLAGASRDDALLEAPGTRLQDPNPQKRAFIEKKKRAVLWGLDGWAGRSKPRGGRQHLLPERATSSAREREGERSSSASPYGRDAGDIDGRGRRVADDIPSLVPGRRESGADERRSKHAVGSRHAQILLLPTPQRAFLLAKGDQIS